MSRVLFAEGAILRPASEYDRWNLDTRILWDQADTCTQKEAWAARWRLRCAEHPEGMGLPAEPLARALCQLELTYRRASHCRGSVRDA